MPAITAAPAFYGAIASGAAGVAGTALAGRAQSQAAQRAARIQAKSDADALAFMERQEAEARRQWDVNQRNDAQRWAADQEDRDLNRTLLQQNQQYSAAREAHRAPYREAGVSALGRLSDLLGERGDNFGWRSPSSVGRLSSLVRR